MQIELLSENPATEIRILGINQIGAESGNAANCDGRDIPWLQDTINQEVWLVWKAAYRDVVILDENNVQVEVYNLTQHDLANPTNYAELKQSLKEIAGELCNSFGDSDGDGICDDADNSNIVGDNPCVGGSTENCDDNCPDVTNPNQEDIDEDGVGDVCDLCLALSLYGEFSYETELLRYFRDNVLTQTPEGREMIKLYYQLSPRIVEAIEADEEFKEDVKEMIDRILPLITPDVE